MKESLKRTLPACFGSSIGVTAVQWSRQHGAWGLSDIALHFIFIFAITTAIVTLAFWIAGRIKKKYGD